MIPSVPDVLARGPAITFFTSLLVATYFVEAGLLLVIGPWTSWWDRNYFLETWPWLRWSLGGGSARVVVTLIGVLTAFAGLADLRLLFGRAFARQPRPPSGPFGHP